MRNAQADVSNDSNLNDIVNLDDYPIFVPNDEKGQCNDCNHNSINCTSSFSPPDSKTKDSSSFLVQKLHQELQQNSVLTLPSFLQPNALQSLVDELLSLKDLAFYSNSSHTIYFKPPSASLPPDHTYNILSRTSRGCITTDQIPDESILKRLYYDRTFRRFLAKVLGVEALYVPDDPLSGLTVHYTSVGQELGWHFDSSAFAITLLLRRVEDGGTFEYLPNVREYDEYYDDNNGNDGGSSSSKSSSSDFNYKDSIKKEFEDHVRGVLTGKVRPKELALHPGTLVLFSGRDSLHRVTKVASAGSSGDGHSTRMLVVFAYNEMPGVRLDDERMLKHFGRILH